MQRMIDCGTWDDPWFADLSPDSKLLFLYLITNRRSTAAGAFEITLRAIAFETGLDAKRVQAALDAFGERVRWWPDYQVIWIRNFYKRQAANEKFTISAQRHVAELPVAIQRVIATVYPQLVPDGVSPDDDTHGNGYPVGMERVSVDIDIEESSNRVGQEEKSSGADAPASVKKGGLSEIQEQRFNRWYAAYPRKVSKQDAVKAWAKITPAPTDELTEQMIAKVQEWATSPDWADPKYIPYPATWLNDGRWEDGAPIVRTGSLTVVHPGGRTKPIDEKERSRIEWRRKHGLIPTEPDDVIDVEARAIR